MAKQSLLVADADPRSLRILDVALRKAGFSVATASDGAEALRRIQRTPPDLILADVALPGTDGVALCKAVRADARLAGTPVILISGSKEAALKLSAHEAGADDFLGKPLLIKELTTRIRMLLTRREQQKLSARGSQATVTGDIGEMGLVDLIQSLDSNTRSAIVVCEDREHTAQIWVRDGQVIDAEAGALGGEAAFYRVLGWEQGTFSAQFTPVDRDARISQSTQSLLAESVRRVDELGRLSEELPLSTILSVDFPALTRRLADLPDEVNGVIRLCDGVRTIAEVMERAPIDELSVLAVLQRLLGERVLQLVAPAGTTKAKPSLMQWLGPDSVATPAPPIMGAHGFPQSGDPTPIAPPVSDPPLPARKAEAPRASADSPQLMFDTPVDPVRVFTPAEPFPAPALAAQTASLRISSPGATAPATAPVAPEPTPPQILSVPPPRLTDVFKLPAIPKAPVPVTQFAPLRGVRRERLRREADEARALVAQGQPVRLTHVVELPAYPAGAPDGRRSISPAVGEAARKFAPDLATGTPEATAAPLQEPITLTPLDEQSAPAEEAIAAAPQAATPVPDDRDLYAESATLQVEPLSKEALAGTAPADSIPAAQPAAPAPAPAAEAPAPAPIESAAPAEKSPWDESTDPLAVAPSAPEITSPGHPAHIEDGGVSPDAPTSPGHRVEGGAEAPPKEAASAPAESAPAVDVASPEAASAPDAAASAVSSSAGEASSSAGAPRENVSEPVVVAPAESTPVKSPVKATVSAEDEFEAEMRAALGKNKRRWPIYLGLAAVAIVAAIFFLRQPPTDKKDSPWLGADHEEAAVAPAAVPSVAPSVAPALDAGVAAAADAGAAIASSDAGAVPSADAGALAAAPANAPDASVPAAADAGSAAAPAPASDEYARQLAAGESLLKRGKYKSAVVELKKAVALNPIAVAALLELGDAFLESDQPRSALPILKKASALDSHSSRAQLLLGTAYQSLGKTGDAVKSYQSYLAMDPSGEYARDVRSILANLQK